MSEYQKICAICGCEFTASYKNRMYCSQKCSQKAYRTGIAKTKRTGLEKITDEQLSQAIDDGLSRQEIATKYGMHVESIAKRMQRIGKYATGGDQLIGLRKNWGKKNDNLNQPNVGLSDCWHFITSQYEMVKERHPDFVYLETRHQQIRLKCKHCGSIIERASSTVRQKNVKCDCQRKQTVHKSDIKKLCRVINAVINIKTGKICECCGKIFYSQYTDSKYCSLRCKNKAKILRRKERDPQYKRNNKRCKREKGYIERAKKYGCKYEYGITIKQVFKKYNGVCQICGKPCNMNDNTYGDYGPQYPSVDHIIPLSKGGTHTWDNVQLAHFICNSYKGDSITV